MDSFLSRFQKTTFVTQHSAGHVGKVKIFFMLSFDQNGATLTIVNEKGVAVTPDYRLYQGEVFNVLRMLDGVRQELTMRINWGMPDGSVRLSEYPYLLFALLRCDNLVDTKMRQIKVSEVEARIVLSIKVDKEEKCSPVLLARTEGSAPVPFQLLSDVFALIDDTVHPIPSLGENYMRLSFFQESFPRALLEQYLSVFYSYVNHVELEYDDYQLERSDQTIATIPTVVIEKVDSDMALYLRLSHTLQGMPNNFGDRFDLTCLAQMQEMEHRVVLRRIVQSDFQQEAEELRKTIICYAPSKTAAKDVWMQNGEFIIPEETAGPFLLQALPMLASRYQLMGAEKLREYKVKAVKPKMKLGLSSGIDFLEGTATLSLDGEEFSLRKFLQQYKKQRYVTLSDGNRALIDESYVHRLERIFKKAGKGNTDKIKV
jgi:hypothetical protein